MRISWYQYIPFRMILQLHSVRFFVFIPYVFIISSFLICTFVFFPKFGYRKIPIFGVSILESNVIEKSTRSDCSGRVLLCLGLESIVIALGINGYTFYVGSARCSNCGSGGGTVIIPGGHIPGFVQRFFASTIAAPSFNIGPVAILVAL